VRNRDSQFDVRPGILTIESKLAAQCLGARLHVPDTTACMDAIRPKAPAVIPDLDAQHVAARAPGADMDVQLAGLCVQDRVGHGLLDDAQDV